MQPVRLLPREQDLGGRPGLHGQGRADRDRVPQPDRSLGGGDADALVALAAVQLRALAGVVAQRGEHGAGRGQQAVLAGGGRELGQPRAEHEPTLHVAGHQPVVLEGDGEPVRGGAGQVGGRDELGEGGRARLRAH